ncbi:protein mono-ADP-ribosyltransferase PARP14-like [Eptesicus fuscus]|uniref:protein mono-ADP-ribosyltransferase PARP14-like n=1 Tax=Eptesicus fuscus TaxID=29078 RepID=UPI002403BF6F|nr:protein mono-ADP-ribosyltransferase PARP14-like [Eptesicus fuscus]
MAAPVKQGPKRSGGGECEVPQEHLSPARFLVLFHLLDGLYGTVTSPASGVQEMKIGPITFQLATGDIAKEEADVIVNSTTKTFDHKAGVSKAILEKAGQNVEIECSRLAQQHINGYIITDGGALKCKNIIHVDGGADVKRSVTCVLQECEKLNHSTICLPAIGTGSAQQDPDKVAEAIMDAIEDFTQKGLDQSVKKVKVVVFQPQIMDVFCAKVKKREGSQAPSQSIISKIACLFGTDTSPASGVHEIKIGPITFQVATGDIAKEEADVIINSTTKTFDHKAGVSKAILEKAGQNVEIECSRLAQQHINGYIITDGGALKCKNIIHIHGGADVKRSVTCVLQECEKLNHSTICLPAIGTGSAQQDPDKVAEAIMDAIEDFIQKGLVRFVKKVKVVIFQPQIMDVFCANMKKREGSQAPSQSIMSKIAFEIPGHWSDMKQQRVCVVELQPGQPQYRKVADAFNLTCSQFKIEKIERIQNPSLWKQYQTKKKTMDDKNGHIQNEKLLFHGTNADSLPHINQHGFNRSYAGKNAAVYGKGTYFAVQALYSADDTYSRPDANGKKHVYYVRVLTGLYALGNRSLLVPPPKNPQNPLDLYDTVTDNVSTPSLFVVFYDYQAYPEYLITFKT